MSARMHPHSPLPAPALHASNPSTQSKSHVLAGVQDAYWSDDEAEDAECPLCLEEMDISDLNFKPCPCGYQICRFCWHHIKENLNRRCPACRREYTDEAVQFKPINKEDHKRLTQQKKQRERERKELDALGRRHLANVRVVQRNVVYVIGMGPRFAKEELIPTLRSSEYFGQYGKISKIVIVKRTSPGGRAPVVGLYITYHRREDAARAIAAVDGAPSPGGGNEIMRASYGTTKYCMAFLRGVSCTEHGCMNLHEWGDEKDCFTKEDLTTLKHTMKDTENRPRTTIVTRKGDEADGLPRAAAWGKQGTTTTALHNNTNAATTAQASTRQTRRGGTGTRQQRSSAAITSAVETRATGRDRKGATAVKASSQASSSRPATPASTGQPARPVTPSTTKAAKQKEAAPAPPLPPRSPTSSTLESESGSAAQDVPPVESPVQAPSTEVPAAPPGLPAVPPGLTAPPGLPPPSRTASTMSSPLSVTVQPSQSSYQMSTQAQALMEDLRARREMPVPAIMEKSPFPDFDRMLQTLSGDDGGFGGFSFNLDPALAGEGADEALVLPELDVTPNTPFTGTFLDAFPGLRQNAASGPLMGPPGLAHPARPAYEPVTLRQPALDRQPSGGSGYTGSFNPFGSDANDDVPSRRYSPLDEERQVSRFTFARGRQGSTSSSLHASSPLNHADNFAHAPYYNSSELVSPARRGTPPQWLPNRHQAQEFIHGPHSAMNSPLAQQAQQAQAHPQYAPPQQQHPGRFQPFDPGVSEAQLRDFINSSREKSFQFRHEQSDPPYKPMSNQPFNDPAIMSARLASPVISQPAHDNGFTNSSSVESFSSHRFGYGPPPGLSFQDGSLGNVGSAMNHNSYGMPNGSLGSVEVSQASGSAHVRKQLFRP
ncbi:uncharacterized protein C8Q71DRAFT_208144 [Rhodofomes roseus]|uniref:RING-type domain-containing protein n=1 Tax=Rhodofomes roseus TaxID=34475 RepID=A0ABQ8KU18_9APHY|nr:uncharacterized protein C8Q71DRAFT_208144 [Rhodofomes roseus]KAH9842550.1 hypothetical protein C8Q71DRAFT_208144 [Rhodofomes roseus]